MLFFLGLPLASFWYGRDGSSSIICQFLRRGGIELIALFSLMMYLIIFWGKHFYRIFVMKNCVICCGGVLFDRSINKIKCGVGWAYENDSKWPVCAHLEAVAGPHDNICSMAVVVQWSDFCSLPLVSSSWIYPKDWRNGDTLGWRVVRFWDVPKIASYSARLN